MNILQSGAQKLGIYLDHQQNEQFETYFRELVAWNEKVNLTAITEYSEVQIKHFLDSLTIITGIKNADREREINVIDIGSGAGFPGIPMKIVLPQIRLVLLEATTKKITFLKHLINQLKIEKVELVNQRAEEAAHDMNYREQFELVVSRAVAPLPTLVELALPFCTTGGCLIAQKKGDITKEIDQSYKAIDILGGKLREVIPVVIDELNDNRSLVIIDKLKPTPTIYPRRPGIPSKKPMIS
jgi:16S rRNA (guanine527-N7)-methyltransferase